MKDSLGTLNPFRYRGYVYDEESGLYYLRSRYYAPSWCRFTNADILVVRNSYCYCGNASLGKYDPDGTEECVVPDYTASINSELQYQLGRFKEHDVSVYQDDSLAQLINTHLGWFMGEVKDGSTISYKTDSVWNQTFTDLPSASHVRTFKFRSYVMTREDLGNFAFGYLGSAMGYSKQNLLIGAGFYKRYKRNKEDAEGNTREFVDLVNKTAEDLLNHYPAAYGNDANDLSMIILGIQEYYTDYPEEE